MFWLHSFWFFFWLPIKAKQLNQVRWFKTSSLISHLLKESYSAFRLLCVLFSIRPVSVIYRPPCQSRFYIRRLSVKDKHMMTCKKVIIILSPIIFLQPELSDTVKVHNALSQLLISSFVCLCLLSLMSDHRPTQTHRQSQSLAAPCQTSHVASLLQSDTAEFVTLLILFARCK